MRDVCGGEGRSNSHDSTNLGDLACRCEHGRAAQRMTDDQRGCLMLSAQKFSSAHEVSDVGTERGVGEVAF